MSAWVPQRKSSSPRAKQIRPWRKIVAGLLVGAALLAVAVWQSARTTSKPPASDPTRESFGRGEPDERVFARYAGSASCRECHEEAYDLWAKSNHAMAERPIQGEWDQAAFQPQRSFQHGSQTSLVRLNSNRFEIITLGQGQAPQPFPVERVIGHDPLRQFLVQAKGGRWQVMEASYDPHRNEWFNVYGNEDRQPGEWGHWTGRGMNWNNMCASCHNTRVRKNYREASDSYGTTMAEMTVGCEACHGPMRDHGDWQQKYRGKGLKDPTLKALSRDQMRDTCGMCHARRSELTGDFQPGDSFPDHFRLTTVDGTDLFYPDGQVREEDYEFAPFLGSRMHHAGVRCSDCHQPHSVKTLLPGNLLCLRCHSGSHSAYTNAPVIDPVGHGHHPVKEPALESGEIDLIELAAQLKQQKPTGGECVGCHMPITTYMQRHPRHDHGFTIPDPLLTQRHGIPNACNRCHADKSVEWSITYVDQWYGAKMDRRTRWRAEAIAAAKAEQPKDRQTLVGLLHSEEIPFWRAVLVKILQRWVDEANVRQALLNQLFDTNAMVRASAASALSGLIDDRQDPVVEKRLQSLLEDPVRLVRLEAAWALRAQLRPGTVVSAELQTMLDYNADQPGGQMQKGVQALAAKKADEALAHFRKAADWDPGSAMICEELAVVLSMLGRPREALAEVQQACRLEPREAEHFYRLGLAWNELGELKETVTALEQAVKLSPRHGRAWYNLGLAYHGSGRSEAATEALVRGESVAPTDPRLPYARATILLQAGRLEEARQAARRAVEIQPDYAPAREMLAAPPLR